MRDPVESGKEPADSESEVEPRTERRKQEVLTTPDDPGSRGRLPRLGDPSTVAALEEELSPELLARLPTAITGLPPLQKRVLILRLFEGRSLEEIAVALEMPETRTRDLLSSGLAAVRRSVGEPPSP
jgi:RNA polymerase sigma factor (sigma-70 family)